jgi:hypothetical protein
MYFPAPFQGSEQPGLKRYDLGGSIVSTSPAATTLTLPEQGVWLATIGCWWAGQTNRGAVSAIIDWYQWGGVGTFLKKTNTIGVPALGGNVTGLTLSDPTNAGAITLTITSSAGNSQINWGANLRLISSSDDQFAI